MQGHLIGMTLPASSIKRLKRLKVLDSEEKSVGSIIDLILDASYSPISFVIGGSRWEEWAESLKIRADIDPVVSMDSIAKVDPDAIRLTASKETLPHKMEESAVPEDAVWLSTLKRRLVVSSDGEKIGKPVDLYLHADMSTSLIVGGLRMEEFWEAIGFAKNLDLLLPTKHISEVGTDQIKIDVSKAQLGVTLDHEPIMTDQMLNAEAAKKAARIERVQRAALHGSFIHTP